MLSIQECLRRTLTALAYGVRWLVALLKASIAHHIFIFEAKYATCSLLIPSGFDIHFLSVYAGQSPCAVCCLAIATRYKFSHKISPVTTQTKVS